MVQLKAMASGNPGFWEKNFEKLACWWIEDNNAEMWMTALSERGPETKRGCTAASEVAFLKTLSGPSHIFFHSQQSFQNGWGEKQSISALFQAPDKTQPDNRMCCTRLVKPLLTLIQEQFKLYWRSLKIIKKCSKNSLQVKSNFTSLVTVFQWLFV